MAALKLTPEQRISLYDRLARISLERAKEPGVHPALAAYLAEIALHYDKVARHVEREVNAGQG
jgi:hypothetical protein